MTGISTRGLDQDETAELHRALVFFWWLALLLLPIGQEASSSAPPSPVLPLSLHAAFILGSTAASARTAVLLPVPRSPNTSTPPTDGSTAATSSASFISSWPTIAEKGNATGIERSPRAHTNGGEVSTTAGFRPPPVGKGRRGTHHAGRLTRGATGALVAPPATATGTTACP